VLCAILGSVSSVDHAQGAFSCFSTVFTGNIRVNASCACKSGVYAHPKHASERSRLFGVSGDIALVKERQDCRQKDGKRAPWSRPYRSSR